MLITQEKIDLLTELLNRYNNYKEEVFGNYEYCMRVNIVSWIIVKCEDNGYFYKIGGDEVAALKEYIREFENENNSSDLRLLEDDLDEVFDLLDISYIVDIDGGYYIDKEKLYDGYNSK